MAPKTLKLVDRSINKKFRIDFLFLATVNNQLQKSSSSAKEIFKIF
jgi:hypothetical protein